MHHLSAPEIENIFSPSEVINIVREGIIHYANGDYSVPQRSHYERGPSVNLIMPAYGPVYYCTKLISVDPHNTKLGLPSISGILVLNTTNDGRCVASMDAPIITALRTAAIGSLGLEAICNGDPKKLGIIGLGVQGNWQSIFALSLRNFDEVFCYSRSPEKFKAYKNNLIQKYPDILVTWCPNPETVVKLSDAIISCTTSKNPVFDPKNINLSEKKFISIGSFAKDMQEFPSEVYLESDMLLLDAETACTEVGDVINAMANNWVKKSNILTLGELFTDQKRISIHDKVVFKSVGMAAFDLALASAIYERIK